MLTFDSEYVEGKRHGKFNKFYDDGNPQILQSFLHDELNGIKKNFDKEGKLLTEAKYEKGKKVG